MARTKSLTSIDAEIVKTRKALSKTQEQYDRLAAKLRELQKHKDVLEGQKIMEALKKSKRSFRELMTFLNG